MESRTEAKPAAAAAPPDPFQEFEARLAPKLEEASRRLSETNDRVKGFIRENPGVCLLGAAALGFLAGRWASRR